MKSLIKLLIISILIPFVSINILIADDMVAYWSFDDGTAKDVSGNNYHGTIVNNPNVIDGIKGKALRFQGRGYYQPTYNCDNAELGDHVLLPSIDLTVFPEFTISMWVNEEGMSSYGGEAYFWFGHINNGWLGLLNHIFSTDELYLHCTVGATDYNNEISLLYDLSLRNHWVKYTMVFKNKTLKLYINRDLVGQKNNFSINYSKDSAALARHWWYYGEERTSARFTGSIDEVKIYKKALTEAEIEEDLQSCIYSFKYADFKNIDNIKFNGNSNRFDSTIKLTNTANLDVGSIWFKNKLSLMGDFTTNFSFKISDGNNFNAPDNSEPGADGLAFVMQTDNLYAIGFPGGGIGYEGLKNSIALEFDTFNNDSLQIENYFDPNGNHAAIQISNNNFTSSKHTLEYCKAINRDILKLKNDAYIYFCKIIYNYTDKRLQIFLSDSKSFDKPIFDLNNFDIANLLKSDWAFFGFTSATGNATESHYLLDWDYCSKAKPITSIYENDPCLAQDNITLYPVPSFNNNEAVLGINLQFPKNCEVSIIDPKFNEIYIILENRKLDKGYNEISINNSNLISGLYFVRIKIDNNLIFKKMIIAK